MNGNTDFQKLQGAKNEPDFLRGTGIRSRMLFGTVGLLALIGGIGGWAANAEMTGAVIGQGQVKVDRDLRAIQHIDGGILKSIFVNKGDSINQGQVLFVLDGTLLNSDRQIVKNQLIELIAKRQRLLAERDGKSELPPLASNELLEIANSKELANELQLFKANHASRLDQAEQLNHTIAQVEGELLGLNAQKATNSAEVKLVQAELSKFEGLKKQGLTEGSRVFSYERDMARLKGELAQINANATRAEAHKKELAAQLSNLETSARAAAQRDLSEVDPKIAELNERLAAITAKMERLTIRAPISGTVNEVSVNTIGGVITPAQKLVTIVPQDAALQIETRIQPNDIDQIYVSQNAKLHFTSFSSRETPELFGTITFVSPATTTEPGTGRTFYLAQIDVAKDQLGKLSGKKLVPGMPVEVFAQTESRTALSYLTKPLVDQFRRAFREN